MKTSAICPCCSCPMLHHISHHQDYWFCRTCWQPMPDFSGLLNNSCIRPEQMVNLSSRIRPLSEPALV